MVIRTLVLLISFLSFSLGFSAFAADANSARLVVHLLDYLAKDYPGAVGEDGKILSDSEYAEQVEFANTAFKASQDIPELSSAVDLRASIKDLHDKIVAKAPPSVITPLARKIQAEVLLTTKLEVSPLQWPNQEKAKKLFADNCVLCHGPTGLGDGPAGVGLDPKPANFHDHDIMDAAAPMGAFNTIRLGVPGTGMPPFPQFSDDEIWGLSFYLISLRHDKPTADIKLDFNSELLKKAATMSDIDLAKDLGVELSEKNGKLATVRFHQMNEEKVNTLDLSRQYLRDAEKAYLAGDQATAKSQALRSYLEGIEPVEPRLRAQAPDQVVALEVVMGAVRSSIEKSLPAPEVQSNIEKAIAQIDSADSVLKSQGIDARVAFVAASGIILREGFEAALIILSLLSIVKAMGSARAVLWVHAGWIAAVILGVISWFAMGVLFDISGAQRELMEGVTSIVAVLVLLGVGFWLHRHTEIGRWTHFIKTKVKDAIDNKNLVGLASISFLAVFREALESVLFIRVIWFESDASAKTALMTGTGITMLFILIASWAAVKYSAKLPISKLFRISSYIMAALAFTLTGKGLNALQESGLVSITPIFPGLRLELAGIYPSVESIGAQILVVIVIAILWQQGKKPHAA